VRASGRRLAVKFKKKGGGEPRFQLKKERWPADKNPAAEPGLRFSRTVLDHEDHAPRRNLAGKRNLGISRRRASSPTRRWVRLVGPEPMHYGWWWLCHLWCDLQLSCPIYPCLRASQRIPIHPPSIPSVVTSSLTCSVMTWFGGCLPTHPLYFRLLLIKVWPRPSGMKTIEYFIRCHYAYYCCIQH
jgi:hypothetical protein